MPADDSAAGGASAAVGPLLGPAALSKVEAERGVTAAGAEYLSQSSGFDLIDGWDPGEDAKRREGCE